MIINERCEEVRSLTTAFYELLAIKQAGFNYVLAQDRKGVYICAFYYRSDAEYFCEQMNDNFDNFEYEVWHVEALMSELDDDACALLYDKE